MREGIDPALVTTDATALVKRGDIDVVVEVIGGIEPARTLITTAFEHGASVVSANKALLAEDGAALHAAAEEHGADLYYEAAVAGAIPLIRPLRESLAGDKVNRVLGIVNGTTNFILDKMDTTGAGYSEALDEATALGYAEADPTADVEGFDAAAKAAILAGIAFHTRVRLDDVLPRGHHRGHRRRHRLRQAHGLHRQAARHLRARRRRRLRHRARAPRDDPAQPPAGLRPRGVQRGLRRGRRRRAADVLRPRRGRCADRLRRPRRPRRRLPQQARRAPPGPASPRTRSCRSAPWARSSRATTSASTWPTSRAFSPRSRRSSPSTACPSTRCASRAKDGDGEASLVVVTHRAPDAALSGDRRGAAQARHRARCRQHHAC